MKHFFLLLLISFTVETYSQNCDYAESVPKELYRERYKPASMWYGNPYTMFNKRTANWNLDKDLKDIRANIKKGIDAQGNIIPGSYADLYEQIYDAAILPEPSKCPWDKSCDHAAWVKNNAVIHLIGLMPRTVGNAIQFEYIETHHPERYKFAEDANRGLSNLNPNIDWCVYNCGHISTKAFDLILYLQAYDALKAAKYFHAGDGDRNRGDCSPRNKLREYSRTMYIRAEDIINSGIGWKKNHGIICASALGMAAIVLNDAGTEISGWNTATDWLFGRGSVWPRPNYNPNNWIKRALGDGGRSIFGGEDGLEDNFFKGDHVWPFKNVPQTNSDGTSGFAEGPGYFHYSLQALLPFMRAQDNFIAAWQGPLVRNHRYENMLEWFYNIARADGSMPTYDNTSFYGNILGILGRDKWSSSAEHVLPNLRADYIIANAAKKEQPTEPSREDNNYFNDESGNAILRIKTDSGNHYFHMLYEKGVAVDKEANPYDGTHEDNDMGSFMIAADNDWLIIDPPYLGFDEVARTSAFTHHNTISVTDSIPPFMPTLVKYPGKNKFELKLSGITSNSIHREVTTYNTGGVLYYMMNDRINSDNNGIVSRINGNGNITETGTGTYAGKTTFLRTDLPADETPSGNGRVFKWTHPCYNLGKERWNVLLHMAVKNGNDTAPVFTLNNSYQHGSKGNEITKYRGIYKSWTYGEHTQLNVTQAVKNTLLQSFIMPFKCGWEMPVITRDESLANKVNTTIRFIVPVDTAMHYYSKYQSPPGLLYCKRYGLRFSPSR